MKKTILIASGIILAVVAFFLLKGSEFYKKIYTPNFLKRTQEKTAFNVLLFGYGGGAHEGAFLTDTIMIFHVDLKTKRASLFSIPRDLWVKLPTKSGADFHIKINALYQLERGEIGDVNQVYPDLDQARFGTKDDAEFTKYILSQSFGLPLDNYVAVDFEGFKKAIDVLGGVDVDVVKTFDDPQYPVEGKEKDLCNKDVENQFSQIKDYINNPASDQAKLKQILDSNQSLKDFYNNIADHPELSFPCRYEKLHFDKGITHMNGATALKYVRSRHSLQDGSDFGRSARQQHLLQAVKEKVLSINFVPKIIPLLEEMGNHVRTDLNLDEIKKFLDLAGTVKEYRLTQFVLSDQNMLEDSMSNDGQFILIPHEGLDQWNQFQLGIQNVFQGILPTPTPSITTTPPAGIKN